MAIEKQSAAIVLEQAFKKYFKTSLSLLVEFKRRIIAKDFVVATHFCKYGHHSFSMRQVCKRCKFVRSE